MFFCQLFLMVVWGRDCARIETTAVLQTTTSHTLLNLLLLLGVIAGTL